MAVVAEALGELRLLDRSRGREVRRAREHRHAAAILIGRDDKHPLPFGASEVHEFAGAAAAAEAIGPVGDHKVDVITQALFVETTIRMEGRDERREETAEGFHRRKK